MNLRAIIVLLGCLLLLSGLVSCLSSPEPMSVPNPSPPAVVVQASDVMPTLPLITTSKEETSAPALPNEPLVLPELGTLVVETTHGNWLLVGDNVPQLMAPGLVFSSSPDGCWLISEIEDMDEPQGACWLARIDGTPVTRLFPTEDNQHCVTCCPVHQWSPDATGFAFTRHGLGKAIPTEGLWWVNIPEGTVTTLANVGSGSAGGSPRFSPDGQWIATSNDLTGYLDGSVGLMRADGSSGRWIFRGSLYITLLEWADDSSGFWVQINPMNGESEELWWVPTLGNETLVAALDLHDKYYIAFQPWTQKLAIGSDSSDSQYWGVHLLDRNGDREHVVPGSEGMVPFPSLDLNGRSPWSPDGRWLLLRSAESYPYLVDIAELAEPQPLDVGRVHGWLDDVSYLTSVAEGYDRELYRCVPPQTCHLLHRLEGKIGDVSYTPQICSP